MDAGWGGLMEGVASGVSGGTKAYYEGQARRKEQQAEMQKQIVAKAERVAKRAYEIATDNNAPKEVRKQAWATWSKVNKEQNTGIQGPEIPDEMWDDSKLQGYLKRGWAILNNKKYNLQTQIDMMKELEREAQLVLGSGTAEHFTSMHKELETKGFTKGIVGLAETGKPTAETAGFLAKSVEGRKALAKTVKAPATVKPPSIPMYVTQNIEGGKEQRMQWNPKTKDHDIPYGEPKKATTKVTYRNLEGNIYKLEGNKSVLVQAGSMEAKAIYNAMREPQWAYLGPAEQLSLVQKHMGFLKGMLPGDGKEKVSNGKNENVVPRKEKETIGNYLNRMGF